MIKEQLILYRNPRRAEILDYMEELMSGDDGHIYEAFHLLTEMAAHHGFEGNVWHDYLAYVLANHENAFSTACEVVGRVEGSVNEMARHDIRRFRQWFKYDLEELDAKYGTTLFAVLKNYQSVRGQSKDYNQRVRNRILTLAKELASAESEEEFLNNLTDFSQHFGVGKFGLHKAFRIENRNGNVEILPITRTEHVNLSDLVGYESQKAKLVENTEAFLKGKKANNVLLYGDAGTGKSSSIKALMNEYYEQGLRLIEVYKYQMRDLLAVIGQIKNRNYKFIIYMDDLSFEEFETEYKYMKAIIEGGMERRPDNMLIYATSNRRHLIKETFSDSRTGDDDLHKTDSIQERLSLAARFGVSIYYGKPLKKDFQEIVRVLAAREGLDIPEEELLMEANKWELSHGGMSGRTATQFITWLAGTRE